MIGVIYDKRVFIIEYAFGLFKRNAVFEFIDSVFMFIPLETYLIHNYIIIIDCQFVKRLSKETARSHAGPRFFRFTKKKNTVIMISVEIR